MMTGDILWRDTGITPKILVLDAVVENVRHQRRQQQIAEGGKGDHQRRKNQFSEIGF